MATAAKISIAIEAQTATLQKGFNEAKSAIKQLDAGMSSHVAMGMAKFQAGMFAVQGAVGAVTGALSSMKQSMDDVDAMAKWAGRLGMSADALTVLGFAAEQAGSSQEGMNNALEKLQKLLGEAAAGSKQARQTFDDLHLSFQQLLHMSPDEQFAAIAGAMQNVGTNAERTKIAMDLFGRSGAQLNNLLSEGTEGLRKYGEEAKKLGLLLGDARGGVEAAGDAMNALNRSWGAMKQRFAIGIADPLSAVVGVAAEWMGWIQGFNYSTEYKIVGSTKYLAKKAAQEAEQQLKETQKTAEKAVEKIKDTWKDIPKPQDYATPSIGAVTMGTAAGFSAVQEALRKAADDRRYQEKVLVYLQRVEAAIKANKIQVATVNIQ